MKQQGMTLIGLLLTAVTVIVLGLIALKVIPVYIQNYQVKNALSTLTSILPTEFPEDSEDNAVFLRKRLDNQLYIEGVTLNNPNILVKPLTDNKMRVEVRYTVVTPLVAQISLLFNFVEAQEVTVGAQPN